MAKIWSFLSVFALAALVLGYQNCAPYTSLPPDEFASTTTGVPQTQPPAARVSVPVIVAAGHMGRTMLSCDGGLSWIHDQSDSATAVCYNSTDPNFVDCDHNASAGHGIDYDGQGHFYVSFGWGAPGTIRRSTDGINWETIYTGTRPGQGIFAFNDKLLLFWDLYHVSSDAGQTWTLLSSAVSPAATMFNPQPYKFGSKVLVIAGEATTGAATSDDEGVTWQSNPSVSQNGFMSGVTYGNGIYVGAGSYSTSPTATLTSSTSTDGLNWTSHDVLPGVYSSWQTNPVYDGQSFMIWRAGKRFKSTDGAAWTQDTFTTDDTTFPINSFAGVVYFDSVTHRLLAITGFYANQRAFWSSDGLTWHKLSASNFTGGHPIRYFVSGYADSSVCNP